MIPSALHLQIISPVEVVVDAHVPSVEIPGMEGDFGVLPGHSLFFSMIRPGVIRVHYNDGTLRRFFATSGYADVTPQGCTVISDDIRDLDTLSANEAQQALAAARTAHAEASEEIARARAAKALQAAEVLVAAIVA